MDSIFADRIHDVPKSFIREILKVTLNRDVISFAGGLPNRDFFPLQELKKSTDHVFEKYGKDILQYSTSEGFNPLRHYISNRYKSNDGLEVPIENILITNGSQQGLDLLGKVLLNRGDGMIMEEPGYLGAIQAFSMYKPEFYPVPVNEKGMDIQLLKETLLKSSPKLMYTVPNFQNPSGISYSEDNRQKVAELLQSTKTMVIEDNPYGDLRFMGEKKTSFKTLLPSQTIMLGSFSKTVIPGFRLGWMVAPENIMQKLIIAKQASDLHTSHFTQCIIYQYLSNNNIEEHINKIRDVYGRQCRAMLTAIDTYFPKDVSVTKPEGGMFLWATLPTGMSALKLFEIAAEDNVVFVPGDPFYVNRTNSNTMRLNFSCVDEATIKIGIERLGKAIKKLAAKNKS